MKVLTQMIQLVTLSCVLATSFRPRSNRCLFVGSFNVKWFTVAKSADDNVINVVADIILRYDVMLMMEIRDDDRQTAMNRLWELVNMTSPYGLSLSKPLGRHPSRYSEQYAFFYRLGKAYLADTLQYDDFPNDEFEREPYSVLIKTSQRSLQPGTAFIGVHIQPKSVVTEMASMVEVADSALRFWDTDKAVILGDLNADCSYMSAVALAQTPLKTDGRFTWLIPDTADTTVSPQTSCAYDRIIVSDPVPHRRPSVFDFEAHYSLSLEEARAISDHFPVEAYIC